MTKTRIQTAGVLAALCAGTVVQTAAAWSCLREAHYVDEVLFSSIGEAEYRFYRDTGTLLSPSARVLLRTFEGSGWDNAGRSGFSINLDEPYDQLNIAAYLVQFGVKGEPPPIDQSPIAPYFYHYGERDLVLRPFFHRSRDEYYPLISSFETVVCDEVNPITGKQLCPSGDTWPWPSSSTSTLFALGIPEPVLDWGYENVTDMYLESDPKERFVAFNHGFTFQHFSPLIEFYCRAFQVDDPSSAYASAGSVGVAATLVHENWHSTGRGHQGTKGACDRNDCDTYVHIPSASSRFSELGRHQKAAGSKLGAYQVDQRFTCDLVTSPADWVPLAVSLLASAKHANKAQVRRYENITGYSPNGAGRQPYTCAEADDILVERGFLQSTASCPSSGNCGSDLDCNPINESCTRAGGLPAEPLCCHTTSFCPGTTLPLCLVEADCPAPGHKCVGGCCQFQVQ